MRSKPQSLSNGAMPECQQATPDLVRHAPLITALTTAVQRATGTSG
jgi:hypothetical protein